MPYQRLPVTPTLGSFQSESSFHPHMQSETRLSDDQCSSISQAYVPKRREITRKLKPAVIQHPTSKLGALKAPQPAVKTVTSQKRFSLDATEFPILASIAQRAKGLKQPSPAPPSDDEGASSSPVPPSYKSTAFDATLPTLSRHRIPKAERPILPTELTGNTRQDSPVPTDREKVVDLDDAWKNIKMQQDEEFADKFREDMLIGRCWEMWRNGFLWITVGNIILDVLPIICSLDYRLLINKSERLEINFFSGCLCNVGKQSSLPDAFEKMSS
jgi:protein SFI1